MPVTLWEYGGKIVENDDGDALIECDECPCRCPYCTGEVPSQIKVRFANIANNEYCASDCPDLNGVWFYLDWDGIGKHGCAWKYSGEHPCQNGCTDPGQYRNIDIYLYVGPGAPNYYWDVQVYEVCYNADGTIGSSSDSAYFSEDRGTDEPDCELSGTLTPGRTYGNNAVCDWSAATCEVAAA